MADLRAFVIEKALKDGNLPGQVFENDSGRQAILPFINMQLAFENDSSSRFGYGVLNGHGLKEDFIAVYDIMAGDTVVLASDGYPVLCDTLEKASWSLKNVLKMIRTAINYIPKPRVLKTATARLMTAHI